MTELDDIRAAITAATAQSPNVLMMSPYDFCAMNGVKVRRHRKKRIARKWLNRAMRALRVKP